MSSTKLGQWPVVAGVLLAIGIATGWWWSGAPRVPSAPVMSAPVDEPALSSPEVELLDPQPSAELRTKLVAPIASVPARAKRPCVSGVVQCRGKPVNKAWVTLGEVATTDGPELFYSSSDAQGRFRTEYDAAGRYTLRAVERSLGFGTIGPIDLNGVNDVEGLEIVLDQPLGTLVGRVVLPDGRQPQEVFLSVSTVGDCRSLRADGTYRIPGVPPGPCRVSVCAAFGAAGPDEAVPVPIHSVPRAPGWMKTSLHYAVDVVAGETVRLDMDVTAEATIRLEGRILIDGQPAAMGYRSAARLFADDVISEAELENGAFLLGAHEPGEYDLRCSVRPPRADRGRWWVRDRVALAIGRQSWMHEFTTGTIRVLPWEGARSGALAMEILSCAGPAATAFASTWSSRSATAPRSCFPAFPLAAWSWSERTMTRSLPCSSA